ncbi:BTB/POZ domain-containing protein At1g63850-like [Vicia villosa]|uniref:BTB/POZ domain-containing protein At1g63850-like n=1 Tax=Vicia villosa TaxID=3911 RepID=UPI00273CB5A1|nr:BTB/POZ domain-containing protein At1g63850-like [Vicia villosa]
MPVIVEGKCKGIMLAVALVQLIIIQLVGHRLGTLEELIHLLANQPSCVEVGYQFYSRAEMVAIGFHSQWLNGIDYIGQSYSKEVSAAIGFDAGVLSCLEYLEAAPWAEDEEDKVASLLSELRLEAVGAGEVLKRVSTEVVHGNEEGNDNEEVLLKLIRVVLEGKDEKARREMKGLVSKMLHENASQNDLRKESLYSACNDCLQLLRHHFLRAAASDLQDVNQIARQADNLHWILDILIDRQIAEDFLKTWASESELSEAHSKVPAVHRFEVSRVTARLFVGIGKGQLLASKEARCLLLKTWLVPFYDDFGWMRRASKGLDRHLIEDGLSNTILTLPLSWQQEILLAWFNRFLNSGEDCPNIQRGFEVWWKRAFWKRNGEQDRTRQLRITSASIEHS